MTKLHVGSAVYARPTTSSTCSFVTKLHVGYTSISVLSLAESRLYILRPNPKFNIWNRFNEGDKLCNMDHGFICISRLDKETYFIEIIFIVLRMLHTIVGDFRLRDEIKDLI